MSKIIIKSDLATIPNKIFLIDGHNLIYKAYFALPKLYDHTGRPTGAIQGTCNVLLKYLMDYPNSLFCIATDSGGKNFRHGLFENYKANRKEVDPELLQQIIMIQDIYHHFGLKVIGDHGHEADDYIASFVKKFSKDYKICILSSDKDLMQLVNNQVFLLNPTKNIIINQDRVREQFGVEPSQMNDFLSLVGDASDNIPGAKKCGEKTAPKILEYGCLNDLIQNPNLIKNEKFKKIILDNLDDIKLSQKLVTMNQNLEIDFTAEELKTNLGEIAPNLYKIFTEYDLDLLQRRIEPYMSAIDLHNLKLIKSPILQDPNIKILDEMSEETLTQIREQGIFAITYHDRLWKIYFENKLINLHSIDSCKEILEDCSIKKITYQAHKLPFENIKGIYDLSIIYYHLMGTKANENFQNIFNYKKIHGDIEKYIELYETGIDSLFEIKHLPFFEEDRVIYSILRQMEKDGILIDQTRLKDLKDYFSDLLISIKNNIIELTGYEFNILSPKQVSDVLFNKLEIAPISKKSKSGESYSTDNKTLEELALNGYVVADQILQYRSIYKLMSSYCIGLADEIDQKTGRIHTKFELNGATTGRILSAEPNLQNIPTRTEEGKKIRSCFVARPGYKLISADYSQVELRILAQLADVKNMQGAFQENIDIHRLTASEVFHIPFKEVDASWRNKAKAVNFGIIYGISSFGLARQLKISASEASLIIKNYLNHYPEINNYLENTKNFASINNYVETMFGRRCYPPSIADISNYQSKSFLERAAINAPIQGTASDLIKKAMIKIDYFLHQHNLKTKMLLQIHDELIFESPEDEIEIFTKAIKPIMENIGAEIKLHLSVEIDVGDNWLEI